MTCVTQRQMLMEVEEEEQCPSQQEQGEEEMGQRGRLAGGNLSQLHESVM